MSQQSNEGGNSIGSQVDKVVAEFNQILEVTKDQKEQALYTYLLNKHPIDNTETELFEVTPLKLCARIGDAALGLAQAVIHGGRVELDDVGSIYYAKSRRRTALHIAAETGALGIARTLLEHGANVNAKDFNNRTPLHLASQNHQKEMINLLVSYNAKCNAVDLDGQTPDDLCKRPMWDDQITQFNREAFPLSAPSSPELGDLDTDFFEMNSSEKKRKRRASGASTDSRTSKKKKTDMETPVKRRVQPPRAKKASKVAPQAAVHPMAQFYAHPQAMQQQPMFFQMSPQEGQQQPMFFQLIPQGGQQPMFFQMSPQAFQQPGFYQMPLQAAVQQQGLFQMPQAVQQPGLSQIPLQAAVQQLESVKEAKVEPLQGCQQQVKQEALQAPLDTNQREQYDYWSSIDLESYLF